VKPRYGSHYVASTQVTQRLVQRSFSWMFVGLTLTALVAIVLSMNPEVPKMLVQNQAVFWGIIIIQLVTVFGLSFAINRISPFVATFAFFLYAALTGVTFTLILAFFDLGTVGAAFFIAAGMFGVCSLLGYVTKRDLTKIGSIALMAIIGIFLATLINLFFLKSGLISLIISYAIVILFCVVTAFDVQMLKNLSSQAMDEKTASKLAVFGALMLYIDFIAIFQNLIYILGSDD
jgi:FtsH-binding integral membrane protein